MTDTAIRDAAPARWKDIHRRCLAGELLLAGGRVVSLQNFDPWFAG